MLLSFCRVHESFSFPLQNFYTRNLRIGDIDIISHLLAFEFSSSCLYSGFDRIPASMLSAFQLEELAYKTVYANRIENICGQPNPYTMRVAVDSRTSQLAGFVELRILDDGVLFNFETPVIGNLAVVRDYRRQGVGTILLNCAENSAKSLGYSLCTLNVDVKNVGALHLYREKHGYWRYADFDRNFIDEEGMTLLIKELV